ncbi:hypothetical protein JMN32_18125 [Fulvivirga sp. 29W222]|uniref:Uncharacterized protein n=1 Tax=Fulvivirga marina TaxID=2494733 RepID=A0A937G071_9BACT|nr:hypothetical protein [Fulvivirga marina]MBL6448237.1 hypothetical protein [Fulvivirga marina]
MASHLVNQLTSKSKTPLRIDAIGALLSAFLLGVVLVRLEGFFGIPVNVLYMLASMPCFFVALDFFFLTKTNERVDLYLRIIALLNISYCVMSLGLIIAHLDSISFWGLSYIIGEIIVVFGLARLELHVAMKVKKDNHTV